MRSDHVKKGVPTAPNRSLFYALGYTREELERLGAVGMPFFTWSERIAQVSFAIL